MPTRGPHIWWHLRCSQHRELVEGGGKRLVRNRQHARTGGVDKQGLEAAAREDVRKQRPVDGELPDMRHRGAGEVRRRAGARLEIGEDDGLVRHCQPVDLPRDGAPHAADDNLARDGDFRARSGAEERRERRVVEQGEGLGDDACPLAGVEASGPHGDESLSGGAARRGRQAGQMLDELVHERAGEARIGGEGAVCRPVRPVGRSERVRRAERRKRLRLRRRRASEPVGRDDGGLVSSRGR